MSWFKKIRGSSRQRFDLASLDLNHLPILSSGELIDLLGQNNRIRSIRRLAASNPEQFDALYQCAMDSFIEAAQLQPASTADHHASLGGLIIHTLEVIEISLRSRKQYLLPKNAGSERIAKEDHAWTYAVFAAALLHDAGKMLTLTRLSLDTQLPWTPHGVKIRETGATHYSIEFIKSPYALQSRVNNSLFHFLPAVGRDLLAQNSEIMVQLTAWLYNDVYESGAVGEIIRCADGESVASNRVGGGERQRLPNAPAVPMVERMMRALRQCIYEDELKFNRSGAAGWVEGDFTYLVCGVAAGKVIDRLHQEGNTDIPTNNTRLFDIWQDHNYVVEAPDNRAIWHIAVTGENYQHNLSMLKFETGRLFHPSRRPQPFSGKLVQREASEIAESEKTPRSAPKNPKTEETSTILTQHAGEPNLPETAPDQKSKTSSTPRSDRPTTQAADATAPQDTAPTGLPQTASLPSSLEDPKIGNHFMAWLRAGLRDKGLKINRKEAMVHIVPEGVLLVTPIIFKAYLQHYGLASADEDELNKQFRRVQARVQKLRMHRKTRSKMNIFKYKIQGPNFSSSIRGWLFPASTLYGEQMPPAANDLLEIDSEVDSETDQSSGIDDVCSHGSHTHSSPKD
ncbi:MAG: TraI domain-containing protein [Gammaproteobacteria bacterium]|nr:TraI domain-containing protein [Gammaproteobacteria bacterium]